MKSIFSNQRAPNHFCSPVHYLARVFAALSLFLALWSLNGAAQAQALDEVRLISSGPDAVLQVRFNVRVQYQRHAPLAASDLLEIYFQILGNDEALTRPIEESISTPGKDPAPGATVTFPVQTGLPVKKVVVRLGRKVEFRVRAGAGNQLIEIVLPGLAERAKEAPKPAAVVERDRYAILLQSLPMGEHENVRAIPARLQDYAVFGSEAVRNGVRYYDLVLGYFESREQALKVLVTVQADFPNAQVFDVVERKEATLEKASHNAQPEPAQPPGTSGAEPPPAPGPAAAAAAAVAAAPDTELDKQGAVLMGKSRAALIAGKNDEAINTLNQLLLLPPNKFSQDAQELVGLARERAGQLDQAHKEYELYLRLFPSGPGATRVRQRLATMSPPELATTKAAKPVEKREPQYTAGGSIAMYYYGGENKVQTAQTLLSAPTTVNQQTISNSNQSSLVTSVDLNGRYRSDTTDTRIVFRDSDQYSFIGATSPSLNRMDALYVDYRDLADRVSVKAGRQSGVTGGLIGRFDGAIVGVDLGTKLRVNAVAGVPVAQDQFVNNSQVFEGMSLEAQNFAEHWGASGFFINQTADHVVDRRAVGGDLRYFDQKKTLYALVDYDVQFATLNAVTLQGTYQFADQTSVALMLDDRKAPTLETSNGLLQSGCTTYTQYFSPNPCHLAAGPYTVDVLRQDALATTASSHQFALDLSRPLGKSWQVSGDLRITSVGTLPTVTVNGQTFPGSTATGNVLSASAQATGSNLYSHRDINVFAYTHLHSTTLDGNQVGFNNLNALLDNKLTLEPNLSFYWETDSNGQHLARYSPGIRSSYKLYPRMSVEGTLAMEHSRNTGPEQNDTTANVFWYLGFRYDLNY